MHDTVLKSNRGLSHFERAMFKIKVRLERKVRCEVVLVDDGEASPTGGAGKRPGSAATGRQVHDLRFITAGVEPRLSQKQ